MVAEEAARKLDAELAAAKQRLAASEGGKRAKDKVCVTILCCIKP